MKHLLAAVGILFLLFVPAVALAQYDEPPSGPATGGGGGAPDSGGAGGSIDVGGSGGTIDIGGSGGADLPVAVGPADGGNGDVVIVDFAFRPLIVAVPVGSSVSWQNGGAAPHTVTANDGAFDSGDLAPGASYSETFSDAGVYRYHCAIHPNMMGTIMVSGS